MPLDGLMRMKNEGVNEFDDAVNDAVNDVKNKSDEISSNKQKIIRKPIQIENIKEIKDLRNRGFSANIPRNNNVIFGRNGRIK